MPPEAVLKHVFASLLAVSGGFVWVSLVRVIL